METFAAQYSRPAKELRQMISDADLFLPGTHFGYADLGQRLIEVFPQRWDEFFVGGRCSVGRRK
jgi:hypothetical protein